jgi:tetratricopeptide (TPR) repeat protein
MGRGQTLKQVREFVARQGAKMDYFVAFDSTQRTTMTYQAFGLPHAVVIGKDGKIAWMGHPATPELKQIINDMIHDRYDAAEAARVAAINQMLGQMGNELYMYMQQGRFEEALGVTDRMLQADPANFDAMQYRILIYVDQLKSIERMREWVNQFLDKHKDDAGALAKAAQLMMAIPDITQRQPDLAVRAAQMAAKVEPDSREVIQAVALTYYEVGDLATAMRYQHKAVELAKEKDEVDEAKAVLAFLENCKKQHLSAETKDSQ